MLSDLIFQEMLYRRYRWWQNKCSIGYMNINISGRTLSITTVGGVRFYELDNYNYTNDIHQKCHILTINVFMLIPWFNSVFPLRSHSFLSHVLVICSSKLSILNWIDCINLLHYFRINVNVSNGSHYSLANM